VDEMKRTWLFWSNEDKLAVGVGVILAAAYESEREGKEDHSIRLGLENEAC
jgi:hypothetical protein